MGSKPYGPLCHAITVVLLFLAWERSLAGREEMHVRSEVDVVNGLVFL